MFPVYKSCVLPWFFVCCYMSSRVLLLDSLLIVLLKYIVSWRTPRLLAPSSPTHRERTADLKESEWCLLFPVLFSRFLKSLLFFPVSPHGVWRSPCSSQPWPAEISRWCMEYAHEFCGLAVWAALDNDTLISLFWIGANYHRPVDLPDTTGLSWREGILLCLESVQPRSKTSPSSSPSAVPQSSLSAAATSSPPPFAAHSSPPFAAKSMPSLSVAKSMPLPSAAPKSSPPPFARKSCPPQSAAPSSPPSPRAHSSVGSSPRARFRMLSFAFPSSSPSFPESPPTPLVPASSAPRKRPPEPAPRKRPPVLAPPERPQVLAPPERPPELLILPNIFFWGGPYAHGGAG